MKLRHAWVVAGLGCCLAPALAQESGAASDPLRAVLQAAVEPSLREGLVVLVVDEAGKPVPGAIVGCVTAPLSQPDDEQRRAFEALVARATEPNEDCMTAAVMLVFTTRYRTDAEGRAILPPDAKRPLMACGDGVAIRETGNAAAGPVRLVLRLLRESKPGTLETLAQPGTFEMYIDVYEPLGAQRTRQHTFRWGSIDVKDQAGLQSFVLEMTEAERDRFKALVERLKQ